MADDGFRIYDEEDVERLLDRMAEEIAASLGDEIGIVGILRRGAPLAERLDWMVAHGAGRVACAVLCAREGRETPIDAEFVGTWLEVGTSGIVDVEIPPYEERTGIVVRHRQPGTDR